jgi:hypothetical protein
MDLSQEQMFVLGVLYSRRQAFIALPTPAELQTLTESTGLAAPALLAMTLSRYDGTAIAIDTRTAALQIPVLPHDILALPERLKSALNDFPDVEIWSLMERINASSSSHAFVACLPDWPTANYTVDFSSAEALGYILRCERFSVWKTMFSSCHKRGAAERNRAALHSNCRWTPALFERSPRWWRPLAPGSPVPPSLRISRAKRFRIFRASVFWQWPEPRRDPSTEPTPLGSMYWRLKADGASHAIFYFTTS